MDLLFIDINFVANLTIISDLNKLIMEGKQGIDVKVYYQRLSKKEKGKLLQYLTKRYDYPASTISAKLRPNAISSLRRDEEENIIKTIESGVWMQ